MSDHHKVLIFGSFTEDESRLFQTQSLVKSYVQPSEKEELESPSEKVQLQFGSLDVASLNSIKGFGAQPKPKQTSPLVRSKDQCPKLVVKDTALENRKTLVSNDLQKTTKAQANGISDNGKDILGLSKLIVTSSVANDERVERSKNSNELIHTANLVKPPLEVQKKLNEQALPARSLLPRGLINLGNLCFLNATLQALLSCSPFVQLLEDLCSRNISKIEYPTLHAFVEFITDFGMSDESKAKKLERGVLESGKPCSPIMFDPVLRNFTPDLLTSLWGRPRQEDAQEFLSFVMDQMHDELLKLEGGHLSSPNGGRLPLVSSSEDDGWETVGPKNKSAVTRTQSFIPSELSAIFGGQLRSVVKARGNKDSATVQPFLLLHLDILPDAVHTIEDALHLFSARETLEGYRASAGKAGVVSASKSVKIQTLSKILILHLMRFSYGSKGSAKLHKPVHFPLELVLARDLLVTPSSEGRKYELVATITHHGQEPSKGHYTADTRYSDSQWLRYDDSSVTAVGPNKVLHEQAYVLFYTQL